MKQSTIVCILISLIAIIALPACSSAENPLSAAELLSLGDKYLLELNYEQAIVYFLQTIEVEPKNPRGYIGAAEAYIGIGEPQRAASILQQGIASVAPEDAVVLQAMLDEVEEVLSTRNQLVDIPPIQHDEDIEEDSSEQTILSFVDDSPFDYLGASPDELAAAWGSMSNVIHGEEGYLYQYGHILAAFDRETNGNPDSDGAVYLLIVPLLSLVRNESGDSVTVFALNELFGSVGDTSQSVLCYSFQGIDVVFDRIPADGVVPNDSVVNLSIEPRQPEPESIQTPIQTQTPATPQTPQTPPTQTFTTPSQTLPTPSQPVEEEYHDEYIEEEIELDVLRP